LLAFSDLSGFLFGTGQGIDRDAVTRFPFIPPFQYLHGGGEFNKSMCFETSVVRGNIVSKCRVNNSLYCSNEKFRTNVCL
jgi:hypothetical protein